MQTTREKISPEKTSMWGRKSFVAARRASLSLSPPVPLSFSRLRLGFRANRRSTVLSRGKELERFLFLVQRQRWRLERRYSRYLCSDSSTSSSLPVLLFPLLRLLLTPMGFLFFCMLFFIYILITTDCAALDAISVKRY